MAKLALKIVSIYNNELYYGIFIYLQHILPAFTYCIWMKSMSNNGYFL